MIKQKLILLLFVITGTLLAVGVAIFLLPQSSTLPINDIPDLQLNENTTGADSADNLKLYRNEEWGFEFEYPKDWIIEEKSFGGYYSKFNVVVRPISGWISRFPVLVNIVLPEFSEFSFKNIKKTTSQVIVGGVHGIQYQYEFEESQETAIILPFGEYKMILGTDDEQYTEIFDQFIGSFKFLK